MRLSAKDFATSPEGRFHIDDVNSAGAHKDRVFAASLCNRRVLFFFTARQEKCHTKAAHQINYMEGPTFIFQWQLQNEPLSGART